MDPKESLVDEIAMIVAEETGWFDLDWIQEHIIHNDLLGTYREDCEKLSRSALMKLSQEELGELLKKIKKSET